MTRLRLAAMAARQVNRPVKLVLSRRQMFGLVGARPYTVQRLTVGAASDGTIQAIRQDVASSTSTFEDWVESSTLQTRILYAVPNVETHQRLVRLNVTQSAGWVPVTPLGCRHIAPARDAHCDRT